jgi:hypothetical protein
MAFFLKRQQFDSFSSTFFGENILKNYNIGPRMCKRAQCHFQGFNAGHFDRI